MRIVNIKTEYLNNPLGLDIRSPRISWNLDGSDIEYQQSFEIVYKVNNSEEKKVEQSTSLMTYQFEEQFNSKDYVTYKIRVQNESGKWSDYSESHYFSIGLLNKSDW